MPVLRVVIPIYNERDTLDRCLERVLGVALPDEWRMELTLIDDCSEPPAAEHAAELATRLRSEGREVTLLRHEINKGKGAALQTGFDAILDDPRAQENDLVIIQDADLEYDPNDFPALMQPLLDSSADAVVGTRWGEHAPLSSFKRRVHAFGNTMLTVLSNIMTGCRVSDMECCYKVMPVGWLRRLRPMLTEQGFGIEPQIVAGLSRLDARIVEVPVRYDPRSHDAGKKIGWLDAVRAVYVIARERLRGTPGNTPRVTEHAP